MSETKFTEWINFINEEACAFEYNAPRPKFNILLDSQFGEVVNALRAHFNLYAALEECEEAIKACIGEIHTYHDWDEAMMRKAMAMANAAIKKARGEK